MSHFVILKLDIDGWRAKSPNCHSCPVINDDRYNDIDSNNTSDVENDENENEDDDDIDIDVKFI